MHSPSIIISSSGSILILRRSEVCVEISSGSWITGRSAALVLTLSYPFEIHHYVDVEPGVWIGATGIEFPTDFDTPYERFSSCLETT